MHLFKLQKLEKEVFNGIDFIFNFRDFLFFLTALLFERNICKHNENFSGFLNILHFQ
jgi:hypothetical protein